MSQKQKALLCLLAANVIFGFSFLFSKIAIFINILFPDHFLLLIIFTNKKNSNSIFNSITDFTFS